MSDSEDATERRESERRDSDWRADRRPWEQFTGKNPTLGELVVAMTRIGELAYSTAVYQSNHESRLHGHDKILQEFALTAGRTDLKNIFLSAVCGAFAGACAGMATAGLMLHYAVSQGWIG